jgi:hypothetical protein
MWQYAALRIAGYLGLLDFLVFWTEHNFSDQSHFWNQLSRDLSDYRQGVDW